MAAEGSGSVEALFERYLEKHAIWIVALVALVLRLSYLIEASRSPLFDLFQVDAEYYDDKSREILSGNWLARPGVFTMSPLYPYFLAAVYGVSGASVFFAKLVQQLVGVGSCVLIYVAGRRLAGPGPGFLSGMLAATYGLFVFAGGTLENEFLVIFFNMAALVALLLVTRDGGVRWSLWAGLCLGLSSGIRPNGVLLLIPALLWLALETPDFRLRMRRLAACLLAACLPLVVIGARNLVVSGEWVLTTSTGGQLVYVGTLDGDGGYALPDFVRPVAGIEHEDFRARMEADLGRKVRASEVSGYWIRAGLARIADSPGAYMKLEGKKLLAFFAGGEPPDNYDYRFERRFSRVLGLPLAGFSIVLPLALVGAVFAARPGRRWLLPYGMIGVYLFTVLLFYQSYRLRLPAVPALILFAGAGGWWLLTRRRDWRALAKGGATLLLGLALTLNPFPRGDPAMDAALTSHNYVDMMLERDRLEDADRFRREVRRRVPDYHRHLERLGLAYMERGEYELAIAAFDEIRRDPELALPATRNIIECLLNLGELALAEQLLREGLARAPTDPGLRRLESRLAERR